MRTFVQYDNEGNIHSIYAGSKTAVPDEMSEEWLEVPAGMKVQMGTHKVVDGQLVARSSQEIAQEESDKRAQRQAIKDARKQAHENKIKPDAQKVKAKYPEVFDLLKVAGIIPESIT